MSIDKTENQQRLGFRTIIREELPDYTRSHEESQEHEESNQSDEADIRRLYARNPRRVVVEVEAAEVDGDTSNKHFTLAKHFAESTHICREMIQLRSGGASWPGEHACCVDELFPGS